MRRHEIRGHRADSGGSDEAADADRGSAGGAVGQGEGQVGRHDGTNG